MATTMRPGPLVLPPMLDGLRINRKLLFGERPSKVFSPQMVSAKTRMYVAAENRLLREALARMLAKRSEMEIVGQGSVAPDLPEHLQNSEAEILLFSSTGQLAEDLGLVRAIRMRDPEIYILLMGMTGEETEFLQCVRAGVRGYLLRDASAEEVLAGVRVVRTGGSVCSPELCRVLFQYFEREAGALPSASLRERLGFTRREQQLIPLVARGLSNKEIANHFCLSEQTVKNHLYRMKQKSGVEDRLGIVRLCRTHGFPV
jgi:DNA-binding NarL/FixJ family response regulator